MARIITVHDEDTGVEARVVVDRLDGQSGHEITDLRIRMTNGRGVRSEDLLILEELGLRMPQSRLPALANPVAGPAALEPTPKPAPAASKAAPKPATAKTATVNTQAVKRAANAANRRGGAYRLSPPVDELQRLHAQLGGPAAIARHYGVPTHTVSGWLKRHRTAGITFDTGQQPPSKHPKPARPAGPAPAATFAEPTTVASHVRE
jgi:hypothetical protein